MIAIGTATYVFKKHWKISTTFYIFAIFITILIIIFLISEILMFKSKTYNKTRITAIEMKNRTNVELKNNSYNSVDAFDYKNSAINLNVNNLFNL